MNSILYLKQILEKANDIKSKLLNIDEKTDAANTEIKNKIISVENSVGAKVDAGVSKLEGQIIANSITNEKLDALRHNYFDDAITKTKIIARAQEQTGHNIAYTNEIFLDIKGSGTLEGLFLSATTNSLYTSAWVMIYIDGEPLSATTMNSSSNVFLTDIEHILNIEPGSSKSNYTTDVTPLVIQPLYGTPKYYRSIKELEKITVDGRNEPSKTNTNEISVFMSKIKFEKSLKIELEAKGSYFPFNTWKPEVFITYTLNE